MAELCCSLLLILLGLKDEIMSGEKMRGPAREGEYAGELAREALTALMRKVANAMGREARRRKGSRSAVKPPVVSKCLHIAHGCEGQPLCTRDVSRHYVLANINPRLQSASFALTVRSHEGMCAHTTRWHIGRFA